MGDTPGPMYSAPGGMVPCRCYGALAVGPPMVESGGELPARYMVKRRENEVHANVCSPVFTTAFFREAKIHLKAEEGKCSPGMRGALALIPGTPGTGHSGVSL